MNGTLDMTVQSPQGPEFPVTEVAFVVIAIPRSLCGNQFHVGVTGHGNHGFGDDVVAVEEADGVVEDRTVDIGIGAGTGLKVDCNTGSGGKAILTEWALDGASHVNS